MPIADAQSLGVSLDHHFAAVRAARTMLVTFGALALGLSMIGLYAALAFAVGERTREIAVAWRSAPRAPTSAASSFVAAWRRVAGHRRRRRGVRHRRTVPRPPALRREPADPLAITAAPAVLIVVAALAISLPARRAMQQDPIIALRAE